MRRDRALAELRSHRDRLRDLGVRGLYLYGSVARDEADEASDVDLLVEPADESFTVFDLVRVGDQCTQILGIQADIHDYGGYERLAGFRDRVGKDIVRVF
jgi:uncharacterized protein